jgi:hypothetical protein
MAKVRIIHLDRSKKDLMTEELYFTEDLKAPAKDFVRPGYVVVSDSVHEMNLPSGFPMEVTFRREDL